MSEHLIDHEQTDRYTNVLRIPHSNWEIEGALKSKHEPNYGQCPHGSKGELTDHVVESPLRPLDENYGHDTGENARYSPSMQTL